MVFNCLHNQAPQYLVDLCQSVCSVASRQHLRFANRDLLVVPRYRHSSYGRRAFFLWPALRYGTGYQTVWETRPSAETPSDVHWRRFYFQLCVHSALELSGRCALQIYLLTYLLTYFHFISLPSREASQLRCCLHEKICSNSRQAVCVFEMICYISSGTLLITYVSIVQYISIAQGRTTQQMRLVLVPYYYIFALLGH